MIPELHTAKQAFLAAHVSVYGYQGWLERHWGAEVGHRLGAGQHYLDNTGAPMLAAAVAASLPGPVHCPSSFAFNLSSCQSVCQQQQQQRTHTASLRTLVVEFSFPPRHPGCALAAGAGLYTNSQIAAVLQELTSSTFGNPHSRNPSSSRSTAEVEAARELVLKFFNADPDTYYLVFTK